MLGSLDGLMVIPSLVSLLMKAAITVQPALPNVLASKSESMSVKVESKTCGIGWLLFLFMSCANLYVNRLSIL